MKLGSRCVGTSHWVLKVVQRVAPKGAFTMFPGEVRNFLQQPWTPVGQKGFEIGYIVTEKSGDGKSWIVSTLSFTEMSQVPY